MLTAWCYLIIYLPRVLSWELQGRLINFWQAAVHGVAKDWTWLSNWTELTLAVGRAMAKPFVILISIRPGETFSSRRSAMEISIIVPNYDWCQLKKDVQLKSRELSFIWGNMRTAAWKAAPQLWETTPKQQWGKVNIQGFGEGGVQCHEALILPVFCLSRGSEVTMEGFSASLAMRRCKDWDHKICS